MKMTAKKPFFLTLLVTCSLFLPLSSHAAFKCWTNKEGVRECGNTIPPEYAQQETETINERGLVTDVQERAKTKEELEQERKQAEEKKRREEEEAARRKKQDAYDRVLLSTFLSEQEIIDSRDRKISAIDGTIEVTRITIDKLDSDLQAERKRAANFERKGKTIPENVQKTISSLERQIADKQSYIASKEQEKKLITEKYAKDLERFRELKASGRSLR
jgi:hypothetical protein